MQLTVAHLVSLLASIGVLTTSWAAGPAWPDIPLPGGWPSTEPEKAKKGGEEVLDAFLDENVDCFGKRCLRTEQCCKGSACVDVDGIVGTCLPIYGQREGEACRQDGDCAPGLRCLGLPNGSETKSCQGEGRDMRKKQYNDECMTTAECDVVKGLCCQLQRRHRMAPRRVCYYFSDPKSCIGGVDGNIKPMNFIPNPFFKARLG